MARDYIPGTLSQIGAQTADAVRGVDARRRFAEMGASRFDAIGTPEAQQWAAQIRRDPKSAIALAAEHGGLGAIEASLQAGRAMSQAGPGRDPVSSLVRGGNLGAAGRLAEIQQRQADAYGAYASADATGSFQPEDFRAFRTDRRRVNADFNDLQRAYRMAAQAGEDSPEWGQALTILFNKVLQPNSAVLEGEAVATARAVMSLAEQLGVTVQGVYQPQTPVGKEGRKRMMALIDDLAEVGLEDYVSRHEEWILENQDMEIPLGTPRDFQTRPGYRRVEKVEEELEKIRARRRKRSPVSSLPIGETITTPAGVVLKRVGPDEFEVVE